MNLSSICSSWHIEVNSKILFTYLSDFYHLKLVKVSNLELRKKVFLQQNEYKVLCCTEYFSVFPNACVSIPTIRLFSVREIFISLQLKQLRNVSKCCSLIFHLCFSVVTHFLEDFCLFDKVGLPWMMKFTKLTKSFAI